MAGRSVADQASGLPPLSGTGGATSPVATRPGSHPLASTSSQGKSSGLNVILAMGRLALNRPPLDATNAQLAAWYDAKGRMHETAGRAGGPDAADELTHAAAAYEHARRLTRSGGAR